jgi:hypothetical protein
MFAVEHLSNQFDALATGFHGTESAFGEKDNWFESRQDVRFIGL